MPEVFDGEWQNEPLTVAVVGTVEDSSFSFLPDSFRAQLDLRTGDELRGEQVPTVHGVILAPNQSHSAVQTDEFPRPATVGVDPPLVRGDELAGDPVRRTFVERIYGYGRWSRLRAKDPDVGLLQEFHSHEKMTLLAHDPGTKDELGRLLAGGSDSSFPSLLEEYGETFLEVLGIPTTRRRHQNVLEHLFGYLSELLPTDKRNELLDRIHAFGRGERPLLDPLVALKEEFEGRSIEWVSKQSYLNPTARHARLKGISGDGAND